ncbi:hypothetical protein FACS1894199_11470 [Bacteroidia bacterium]|nr:hypothetical protein FACS1894199_11470 [Bacteroidia bacterium]
MAKQTKQQTGVIALLDKTQPSHATQSIALWKQAIKAFENTTTPVRVKLYEMYEDMLLDGQVEATWGKRRDNILNKRLIFVRDGVEDEQVTKLLNSPDMRNVLREILNTVVYGYTLLQFDKIWYDPEQECHRIVFDLIPRENVHPEVGFECISKKASECKADWLYKNPPLSNYMLYAGEPKDKGLFVKIAPYIIYKRGAMGDWSQFSEMFGMPFREAIYDAFDDETRKRLEGMMDGWTAGQWMVHQKNVEVKLTNNESAASSSEVYENFIKICDAGISKTLVGNTLTTEQGDRGSRSLGDVHESEEGQKKRSDELFVLSVLNTQFRSILRRFGINAAGGEIWFETPDKDWEALQKKWEVVSGISSKVPVADDFIYEEFDIPKPDNYEELKEEMRLEKMAGMMPVFSEEQPPAAATAQASPGPAKKDVKNSWYSRLVNFFA